MSNTNTQAVSRKTINQAMSYKEYRSMIDNLLKEGKTTGENQSDEMTHYTKMNVQRMKRLDKQLEIRDSLQQKIKNVDQEWIWLVLTEGWCGDAAQNVPVMVKMADINPNIQLKLILRDEHPDIMDQHLTNGGRSIPKLICLNAHTLEELGSWGPRPESAQSIIEEMKQQEDPDKMKWIEKVQKWYASDKSREMQAEFEGLIDKWQ